MYLIKTTSVATPENTNFYPCTQVWLKDKHSAYMIEDSANRHYCAMYTPNEVKRMSIAWDAAYKTKNGTAMKAATESAEWETRLGHWVTTAEWVEI